MPGDEPAGAVLAACADRGWSVTVAESLTGGLLAAACVAVPGASTVFRGGVVSYATDLKATVLGVDAALLAARGAVDPEVALAMADGVRSALGGDVGLATTGVAGPDPSEGKPVGEVYVAVVTPVGRWVEALALSGDRMQIRTRAVRSCLVLAVRALAGSAQINLANPLGPVKDP